MTYAIPTTAPDPGATPELPTQEKLRLLWGYASPHRALLAVGVLLGLIATAMELATPMVTRWVLDGLALDQSLRTPVTILAVLLVAGTFIGLVQGIMLGTLAERIILSTRTGMVRHLLGAKVTALANRSSGEMVARVTSDTLLIREATTTTIVYGINGVIALVGALVLMAALDAVLLGVTFGIVVVVAIAAMVLMPQLAKAQQEAQAEVGSMGGRLEGVLRALRTVKASGAEARETERIGAFAARSADKAIRAVKIENIAWTITGAGINLCVLVVLGFGAVRVSSGALDVASLVAFLLYLFQLMWPVMMLTMAMTALQSGLAAAARVHEVRSMPLETDGPGARELAEIRAGHGGAGGDAHAVPGQHAAGERPAALELHEVSYRYAADAPLALDRVSLRIPRTGHTAIVGPSGAGKTTVFGMLLKFLEPESGTIELDGRDFQEWTLRDLRSRIAYVEQDTPIVPGTLRENLSYARPEATEAELLHAVDLVRLSAKVSSLERGLDSELTGAVLSGGERQRVALARALVVDPELLLLDEVTAQLDGLTEAAVAAGIRRQARRGAVVTIAHRLSTVMDADQIIVMQDGGVRAVGTHAELLAQDTLYAELVAALRISSEAQPEEIDATTAGADVTG